ncbi:MAG: hypothetical protein ACJ8AW_52925, partial [Rhodopila sp.]
TDSVPMQRYRKLTRLREFGYHPSALQFFNVWRRNMTLLADMQAQLPIGSEMDLSIYLVERAGFDRLGTFEVSDVNCAAGEEDAMVFVTYRPVGGSGPGTLLPFTPDSAVISKNDPQIRIDAVRRKA